MIFTSTHLHLVVCIFHFDNIICARGSFWMYMHISLLPSVFQKQIMKIYLPFFPDGNEFEEVNIVRPNDFYQPNAEGASW